MLKSQMTNFGIWLTRVAVTAAYPGGDLRLTLQPRFTLVYSMVLGDFVFAAKSPTQACLA